MFQYIDSGFFVLGREMRYKQEKYTDDIILSQNLAIFRFRCKDTTNFHEKVFFDFDPIDRGSNLDLCG